MKDKGRDKDKESIITDKKTNIFIRKGEQRKVRIQQGKWKKNMKK